MTDPPVEDEIRTLWQNQSLELAKMSVEEIRRRAQRLQRKNRREVLLFCAFALLFVLFFGRSLASTHETLPRIGLALLIAWALYFPYQAHKRIWPRSSAAEAASTTCLEFYRRELQRRRDYTLHVWQWFLGPLSFSLGVFLLPAVITAFNSPTRWLNLLPFGLLLALWAAVFFPRRRRELRKLQQEIDGLDAVRP
jgi:hypothetical protein